MGGGLEGEWFEFKCKCDDTGEDHWEGDCAQDSFKFFGVHWIRILRWMRGWIFRYLRALYMWPNCSGWRRQGTMRAMRRFETWWCFSYYFLFSLGDSSLYSDITILCFTMVSRHYWRLEIDKAGAVPSENKAIEQFKSRLLGNMFPYLGNYCRFTRQSLPASFNNLHPSLNNEWPKAVKPRVSGHIWGSYWDWRQIA